MNKRSYVLQAFIETPWAILPGTLVVLEEIVVRHVSGEKLEADEIQARIQGAAPRPQNRRVNSVAVLPLFGAIIPRADMFEEMSGATSAEKFGMQFSQLLQDPSIDAIVLDVNSPGGQVGGIEEVAKQIYDARGTKPVIAVANQMMASAAYWIGTAADELVVTPSGEVGSIGVFSVHNDISAALDKAGLKLSVISAGKYKVEANPWQPLTAEAQDSIQTRVNEIYDVFVNAVARHRGVSPDAVRNGFGEGRVIAARQAVELGMADRVATLDETVAELLNRNVSPALQKADASTPLVSQNLSNVTSGVNELKSSGQVPALENSPMQEARARLDAAGNKQLEGVTPMLRELLKKRADKLARAEQLVQAADAEERDLTDAERAEFVWLLGEGESTGEIGVLDAKIEQVQGEREKLRIAAEKKFASTVTEKPESVKDEKAKVMKLAEFNALDPKERTAFSKAGGKLED